MIKSEGLDPSLVTSEMCSSILRNRRAKKAERVAFNKEAMLPIEARRAALRPLREAKRASRRTHCKHCGNALTPVQMVNNKTFCSVRCAAIFRHLPTKPDRDLQEVAGLVRSLLHESKVASRDCECCGKPFSPPSYGHTGRRFCSKQCASKASGLVRRGARPTQSDVARIAGVGHSTVENILALRGKYRASTIQRVASAVKDLGYRTPKKTELERCSMTT